MGDKSLGLGAGDLDRSLSPPVLLPLLLLTSFCSFFLARILDLSEATQYYLAQLEGPRAGKFAATTSLPRGEGDVRLTFPEQQP